MRKLLYPLLAAPMTFVIGFFTYVEFSNDPGCGSLEPGACFGFGLLMMIVAPLAVIALIALFILIVIDLGKARKNRKSVS